MIRVSGLNFRYPTAEVKALTDINLELSESEFVVLCGKSGCGKSTLLRHLKLNMTPYGERIGEILYRGKSLEGIDERDNAKDIGFVQQNPDNQLVTDKVWHELAFGLESLGLKNDVIRRRVAEMASFFGIQEWFRQEVASLSGGQKQLLNLASIMAMQPKLLILDEPTAQLDPIAASEFLKTVYKINRELGVTVLISEHRLEELIPAADRVIVMDEGKIIIDDTPHNIGQFLSDAEHPMFYGLPSVMKLYSKARKRGIGGYMAGGSEKVPLTIREGRLWLENVKPRAELKEEPETENNAVNGENTAIKAKELYFKYQRDGRDILRGVNLDIRRGELFCLLGGNGVGKSTTLKAVSGIIKPQYGKVEVNGKLAMLPQNPQALFTEITVEEELLEALHYVKLSDRGKVSEVEAMLESMEICHLRKAHPYDLSGGEQQRLALGKILLLKPEILLLDEPTKGLDPFFKLTLAKVFNMLTSKGVTIFMVSHDIEFCAEFSDTCAMFFDGEVISAGNPRDFFSGNNFYTTSTNRIVRNLMPMAITWEEAANALYAD